MAFLARYSLLTSTNTKAEIIKMIVIASSIFPHREYKIPTTNKSKITGSVISSNTISRNLISEVLKIELVPY